MIISGAFIFLLAIQFYWTNESIRFAHQQFEQNVRKSFHTLNRDLEKQEAAYFYKRSMGKKQKMLSWHEKLDSIRTTITDGMTHAIDEKIIHNGHNDKVVFKQKIKFESDSMADEVVIEFNVSDSGNIHENIEASMEQKSRQMEHIFVEMMSNMDDSLYSERMNLDSIENTIHASLQKNGISTPFHYKLIRHTFMGSETIKQSEAFPGHQKTYRNHLLPGLLGRGKSELILSFPDRHVFIAKNVWLMLISSIILIIVLIYAFYYSIRSLIRQRKIAEMKNDFISNMTHELKTPITSINLACETINDPSFDFNKTSVTNYLKVISDENKRLKTLVNNVLDSSFADSGKLSLKLETIDIVELIEHVKNRFSVILERAEGSITLEATIDNNIIVADRFHLSNAIFNLIDNGIKYTETHPYISIKVERDQTLRIHITDRGIGIGKAEQKHIFDKFHRVSTGNVHDVKGFGLGLSYVKRVAEMHKGNINVQSELGKGSTFSIELPL